MSSKKPSKKELAAKELAEKKQSACNASMFLSDSSLNAMLTMHTIQPETDFVELFKLYKPKTDKVFAGSTEKNRKYVDEPSLHMGMPIS